MEIRVMDGGLLTTVQDLGRFGYQLSGISAAGPMDSRSFRIANLLVGNGENAAALEATIMGPRLEMTADTVFAVTGGDLQPALNGRSLPMYRAIRAGAGDVLSFRGIRTGCRAYVAFSGGIDVPEVLGSRSTLVRAGFGGYEGRRLQKGDTLKVFDAPLPRNLEARAVPPEDFSAREVTLRVIMGPQDDRFTEKGIETFLSTPYTVTDQFDRMGCRFEGEKIEHLTDANIISDGIALGAVQVPGSGLPIIMAAERQPTGGYTKIASVCSVDMSRLGQCKAGDAVRFERIGIHEAQDLYLAERAKLEERRQAFAKAETAPAPAGKRKEYRITLGGVSYAVTVEEADS